MRVIRLSGNRVPDIIQLIKYQYLHFMYKHLYVQLPAVRALTVFVSIF
jgi:hypothetical protein